MHHNHLDILIESQQLFNAGKYSLAETKLKECLSNHPKNDEACFLLGQTMLKQDELNEALRYFKQAQHLQPFNHRYVLELGSLYTKIGQLESAANLYQGFLSMDKTKAEVFYQFGLVLLQLKHWQGAFEVLQTTLSIDPTKLEYYMSFGHLLYMLNRPQDALKVYLSALSKGLKSESLFQNAAKLLTDFGELDQAKNVLEEAIKAFPKSLSFIYRLHALDASCLTPELKVTLDKVCESDQTAENLFYAKWLLSKLAKEENDVVSEVEKLEQAHHHYLSFAKFPVPKDVYLNTLKKFRLTDTLSKSMNGKYAINEDAPIFIVGVPRCGSTLIENIIHAGSSEVDKGEETGALFHALSGFLKNEQFVIDGLELTSVKETASKIYSGLNLAQTGKRFTDKSLENIFLIDLILVLYPNAKIIYCDRNPIASIASILKNNLETLSWAHSVEDIFAYVDLCFKAINRFKEKYPEQILSIRYEDLVQDAEAESKKIMEYCDLQWTADCLNFHKEKVHSETASHIQIREAINQKALNNHLVYEPVFADYIKRYQW